MKRFSLLSCSVILFSMSFLYSMENTQEQEQTHITPSTQSSKLAVQVTTATVSNNLSPQELEKFINPSRQNIHQEVGIIKDANYRHIARLNSFIKKSYEYEVPVSKTLLDVVRKNVCTTLVTDITNLVNEIEKNKVFSTTIKEPQPANNVNELTNLTQKTSGYFASWFASSSKNFEILMQNQENFKKSYSTVALQEQAITTNITYLIDIISKSDKTHITKLTDQVKAYNEKHVSLSNNSVADILGMSKIMLDIVSNINTQISPDSSSEEIV